MLVATGYPIMGMRHTVVATGYQWLYATYGVSYIDAYTYPYLCVDGITAQGVKNKHHVWVNFSKIIADYEVLVFCFVTAESL